MLSWHREARTVSTPVLEVKSSFCYSLTASLCLTAFLADSKVSFRSNWTLSDRLVSLIPAITLSRIILDFKLPCSQCSASSYRAMMYSSADSPDAWLRLLNLGSFKNKILSHKRFEFLDHWIICLLLLLFTHLVKRGLPLTPLPYSTGGYQSVWSDQLDPSLMRFETAQTNVSIFANLLVSESWCV